MHLLPYYLHVGAHVMNLSHCYQREERNLATFLAAAPDTWVSSAYELDGPQYQLVVSLFIQSLSEWEEHRTTILKRLLVLAHARNSSSSLIKSLSLSSPAEFSVYKPLLMMFSLVDSLHRVLKTTLSVSGSDLPTALLEHVRTNDSTKLPQTPGTSYSATQRGLRLKALPINTHSSNKSLGSDTHSSNKSLGSDTHALKQQVPRIVNTFRPHSSRIRYPRVLTL
ncbi:protein purity of essence-like isoform X2 [Halichondria panicea]|uniref:protein purity of essence-like isoform X2 n=1 Tax=Halichondria panicea TaxID=6063 RepID=UPI00312BBE11